MKKMKVVEVNSSDGEEHYLLFESNSFEHSRKGTILDATEVKKLSKRDAGKPLFVKH